MKYVALLRGINVTGKNLMPMKTLQAVAEEVGLAQVRTHLQTGNLLFSSAKKAPALEVLIEGAITQAFGFSVPVIVRSQKELSACCPSPFPEAEQAHPNLLLLGVCKGPIPRGAPGVIESYGTFGERVEYHAGALWIDFPNGSGRSKITPKVLDRACGAPVTTRNFNTVSKLIALLNESD